ncbi:ABC transporter permease [Dictyobacter formicarum]|uniref:Peptide ABC transporter n=1 Tax=Dictyobacter formicarum TaxID=2778368 RepID=A0ABQ3VQN0_9CHLR|nr:ABC transporter permease [Dictyobacter formicarum]GHO87406.1 peptide ABC transporter [Dictyobacter formicarum]
MTRYTVQRLLFFLPVALLVSFITFFTIHLVPGDPARVLLGEEATPQSVAALRQQLGLDQALPVQFALWLWLAIHGNLGQSIQFQQPVSELIGQRLPVTVELGFCSLILSLLIAFPLGIFAATHRNSWVDWVVNIFALLGTAIPSFVIGLLLLFLLAVSLRVFPPGGYVPFNQDPLENLHDLILPMLTLSLGSIAVNMRQLRASMIEVLNQDYIRTARAKGLAERKILYLHALRNAILPVLTIVGIQVGAILAGTFVVESIFLWPGVGQLAVSSILAKDYSVVQGIVLLTAISYMLANLLVDLSYGLLNPQIRFHHN